MKKLSLLERLTGSSSQEEYDDFFDTNDQNAGVPVRQQERTPQKPMQQEQQTWEEPQEEGELAVDVYQTPEFVVIKALVAGVIPQNLDISLTRTMATIRGVREDEREVANENYFQKELYWGAFSRTILLPEEVDVDLAEAYEKHGILIIRLPKINKSKETKLKVKSR